jgi:hypothetical protein
MCGKSVHDTSAVSVTPSLEQPQDQVIPGFGNCALASRLAALRVDVGRRIVAAEPNGPLLVRPLPASPLWTALLIKYVIKIK